MTSLGRNRLCRARVCATALLLTALSLSFMLGGDPSVRAPAAPVTPERPAVWASLPLRFEEGPLGDPARFVARARGITAFLGDEGATLLLAPLRGPRTTLTLRVDGGRPTQPRASNALVTRTNYIRGRDPARWRTGVLSFARVTYASVLDGVDLVFHGRGAALEYDFVIEPGVDPALAVLTVEGAQRLSLTEDGDLSIQTAAGEVVQPRPRVYQEIDGRERELAATYRIIDSVRVGFEVASYDAARELVIDPTLVYATYLGGNNWDEGTAIAVDAAGSIYVTGTTTSIDFPTVAAEQPEANANTDAFVTKLDPTGASLLYATYLGGRGTDEATGIALDSTGHAYVTGQTLSDDFPTVNALYGSFSGPDGGCPVENGFVAELSESGAALVYSTYLAGTEGTQPRGIAVDPQGNAYVAGSVQSPDFPTKNPLFGWVAESSVPANDTVEESFVTELGPSGTSLVYSTFLPSSIDAIAVDALGDAYVTGLTSYVAFPTMNALQASLSGSVEAFVTEIAPGGTSLVYSTFLGGGDEVGTGIAVDAKGAAYVTGGSVPGGAPLGFVTKLAPSGTAVDYATSRAAGIGIAVDSAGIAYVAGDALPGFPTVDPLPSSSANVTGVVNGAVAALSADGSALVYSTYLGDGSSAEGQQQQIAAIAVSADGNAYVTGFTDWSNFPTTRALCTTPPRGGNAFVAWIAPAAVTTPGAAPSGDLCPAPTGPGGSLGGPTGAPAKCLGLVPGSNGCAAAPGLARPARPAGVFVAALLLVFAVFARRFARNAATPVKSPGSCHRRR
jgi:hypothetical protein